MELQCTGVLRHELATEALRVAAAQVFVLRAQRFQLQQQGTLGVSSFSVQ
jgi:hypothetical protein